MKQNKKSKSRAKKAQVDEEMPKKQSFEEDMENFGEKMEEIGENVGKAIEQEVEKRVSGPVRKIGYVFAIFMNLLLLWAAHNVVRWDYAIFDFILDDFNNVLWAIDLSLGVSIVINLVWIFYDGKYVKGVLQIVSNAVGLFMMYILLWKFPYEFRELIDTDWINTAVRILMILGMVAVTIATFAEGIKLVVGGTQKVKSEAK